MKRGDRIELGGAVGGVWSYIAVAGGVDAPAVLGSRSTNVREGIGRWLGRDDVLVSAGQAIQPEDVDPPAIRGPVRIFGELPGSWRCSTRMDRMGYHLEGEQLQAGRSAEWSEPMLPGCVQILPSGMPVVLMVEGSTVGGYEIRAVVHSEDLRLVAQTPPGELVEFVPV